jgi:hypothetical protein
LVALPKLKVAPISVFLAFALPGTPHVVMAETCSRMQPRSSEFPSRINYLIHTPREI